MESEKPARELQLPTHGVPLGFKTEQNNKSLFHQVQIFVPKKRCEARLGFVTCRLVSSPFMSCWHELTVWSCCVCPVRMPWSTPKSLSRPWSSGRTWFPGIPSHTRSFLWNAYLPAAQRCCHWHLGCLSPPPDLVSPSWRVSDATFWKSCRRAKSLRWLHLRGLESSSAILQ